MDEKANSMKGGLRWMYDLELVNEPVIQQNFYENIFYANAGIKDLKVFFIQQQKSVLIYIKLKLWSKWFKKDAIHSEIENIVSMLLPNYRVRIVDDESILETASNLYNDIYGVKNEKSTDINNANDPIINDSSKADKLQDPQDILPDQEESTHAGYEVCDETKQSDK